MGPVNECSMEVRGQAPGTTFSSPSSRFLLLDNHMMILDEPCDIVDLNMVEV